MFPHATQVKMILAMPSAKTAYVWGDSFVADFRNEAEPVIFNDGSVESDKPFCIVTAVDVAALDLDHGTQLTIDPQDWAGDNFWDETWYVVGKKRHQDGMYRLTLSKEP
jgi:hypothetical protein